MNRLSIVLAGVAGLLAGALGYAQFSQPEPTTDVAAVRAIVESVLDERSAAAEPAPQPVAQLDPTTLNPMIENFLMSDPRLLQRLSVALEETLRSEEQAKSQVAITDMHDKIFNDPGQVVLGNPDGDVTLVEFFDYNCGYCRAALPDLATLLADDPNLRVILKEFPILSNESIDAARVAVLVGEADVDYWTFHETLFSSRGKIDKAVALDAAASLGLSAVSLELQMGEPKVAKTIQTSYEIAQALGITGTPTYIIGNEIIPGAIGIDELQSRIANMRACGETVCS